MRNFAFLTRTNTSEIDSPEGNAKTLYNVMDQPTRALKIVTKREVDLDWRNRVGTLSFAMNQIQALLKDKIMIAGGGNVTR